MSKIESPMIKIMEGDKLVGLTIIMPRTATDPQPTPFEKEIVRIFHEHLKLQSRISELQKELEGYYAHETELNQDIKDLKDVVEPQKERISKLQGEIEQARAALEKMRNENSAIRLRNEAVEEMMICYRIGKKPTEELFDKLDSSKKMLTATLTPPVGEWGHDADKCKNPDCENGKVGIHGDFEIDCPECNKPECKTCGGSRTIPIPNRASGKPENKTKPCPVCNPNKEVE